jgi:ectoine hydroxylase-related dioxygenase (phytanoyl-CoA dioxygenase family)
MDRAVYKVPVSQAHPQHADNSVLHWDIEPRRPSSQCFQAMLYLTDAGIGEGCFECVPTLFRELECYLDGHPGPLIDVALDMRGHESVQVPAKAGDLVIWSARLPHRGAQNYGPRPRLSLPVTMFPEDTEDRQQRITCWREKRAPAYWRGWRGQIDPEAGEPARLTALGRRLVGLERWD